MSTAETFLPARQWWMAPLRTCPALTAFDGSQQAPRSIVITFKSVLEKVKRTVGIDIPAEGELRSPRVGGAAEVTLPDGRKFECPVVSWST